MVKQYTIYWVNLDPTIGEIKKTRPAVVISPYESNKYLNTVIIAPLTSTIRKFPMRLNIVVKTKKGQIALDQLRCVDKSRLGNALQTLKVKEIIALKNLINEYLVS